MADRWTTPTNQGSQQLADTDNDQRDMLQSTNAPHQPDGPRAPQRLEQLFAERTQIIRDAIQQIEGMP
ncbi:hypothetical protein FRB95_010797 [Tulasnella sp. JGI-2019a]|nr:hypothetical protein FRB95_010797 [Tulasnella sp. JGI-2019a]